jgi:hypothetical protein
MRPSLQRNPECHFATKGYLDIKSSHFDKASCFDTYPKTLLWLKLPQTLKKINAVILIPKAIILIY